MTTEKVVGEYSDHPAGFILAIPANTISSSTLDDIKLRIFKEYRCLLLIQQMNSKHIVRPFNGLPKTKGRCCHMLKCLCSKLNIGDLKFSKNLVSPEN